MHHKRKAIFLAAIFSIAILGDVAAQCSKTWVRKKCVPKITPFIHNGQMNTTPLKEGGRMETTLTFYSGQDYRILVCAEETLENVFSAKGKWKTIILFQLQYGPASLSQPFNQNLFVKNRFLGIQANTSPLSYAELDNSSDLKCSEPIQFAEDMLKLRYISNIKVFGGCCGTDNRHMEQLAIRL